MRLLLLFGIPVLGLITSCGIAAQTPSVAAPVLETSSVKLATLAEIDELRRHSVAPGASFSGNRVTVSALNLISIIRVAYNVRAYQISGEPKWTDDNSYDIIAKAEGEGVLGVEQFRQLLQEVLTDRFGLNIHREEKDRPVYVLTVGSKGPLLKESTGGQFSMKAGRDEIDVTGGTTTQLAASLSANVDRPVFDKTGLKGKYDFKLQFVPASFVATPDAGVEPSGFPSIFTAVQGQLGLKLQPTTAPIEMLVIDHIEQPSAN